MNETSKYSVIVNPMQLHTLYDLTKMIYLMLKKHLSYWKGEKINSIQFIFFHQMFGIENVYIFKNFIVKFYKT